MGEGERIRHGLQIALEEEFSLLPSLVSSELFFFPCSLRPGFLSVASLLYVFMEGIFIDCFFCFYCDDIVLAFITWLWYNVLILFLDVNPNRLSLGYNKRQKPLLVQFAGDFVPDNLRRLEWVIFLVWC